MIFSAPFPRTGSPSPLMRCLMGTASLALLLLAGCSTEIPREKTTDSNPTPEASAPSTATPAGARRIVILVNNPSSYWDACRAGVQEAERDLNLGTKGLTAVMEVPDGTLQGQLDRLRQLATQTDIAAVGISPLESDNAAIADELAKLKAKGLPIVTFDSDLNRDKYRDLRTAFLGTNNFGAGAALGRCAAALRPQGGGYVTFVGRTGAQNAIERIDGFGEGAGSAFQLRDKMADDGDRSRARENVRNALQNHPDLTALVGIWSYNAPAIVDVVRERKAREQVSVVVFDAEPLTIEAMAAGDVDALVVQNPYAMGYQSVRLLAAMVAMDESVTKEMLPKLGEPEGDIFDTGTKVVVPSTKSPIQPSSLPPNVEFLTLEDFRAWLTKYGLSGS